MSDIKRTYLVTKEIQHVAPMEECNEAWKQGKLPKDSNEVNLLDSLHDKYKDKLGVYMFCGNCKEFGKAIERKVQVVRNVPAYETNATYSSTTNGTDWVIANYIEPNNYTGTLKTTSTHLFKQKKEKVTDQYTCPHCGYSITRFKETREDDEKLIWLDYKRPNTDMIWQGIFDEGDKIIIKTLVNDITPFNDKLQIKTVHYRTIMNVRTGFTYDMIPYKDGKPLKGHKAPRIKNISNCARANWRTFEHKVLAELAELVHKKKCEFLGYNVRTIIEHAKEFKEFETVKEINRNKIKKKKKTMLSVKDPRLNYDIENYEYNFDEIVHYNRMPNFNCKQYHGLVNISQIITQSKDKEGKCVLSFRLHKSIGSIKHDNPDPIGQLLRNCNLPVNKTYRQIIRQNPKWIYTLEVLHKKYKEIQNIKKIFDCECFGDFRVDEVHRRTMSVEMKTISNFSNMMIEKFGETKWVNKLTEQGSSTYYVKDTAKMYNKLRTRKPELEIDLRGNIIEIHDRLSDIVNKLKEENVSLEYEEKFLKLNNMIDGYEFCLAKETDELKLVGNIMKICVGGYRERALEKELNIVLVKKDGQYRICIELSDDFKKLNQAKIHCNKFPSGELLKALITWMDKHNIKSNNQYDVPLEQEDLDKRLAMTAEEVQAEFDKLQEEIRLAREREAQREAERAARAAAAQPKVAVNFNANLNGNMAYDQQQLNNWFIYNANENEEQIIG